MLHPDKQWHYETLARRATEALKKNDFDAVYVANSAEARDAVLSLMPQGATVGFGWSMSLQQIGLMEPLKAGEFRLINPPWVEDGMSREKRMPLRRQAAQADVFLAGTNAVTLDGKLVNVDSTGNRVAGMLFGPRKTILVVGANKVVRNLDEALDRAFSTAAPANARRLDYKTPCSITGVCNDCQSEERICRATVILHRMPRGVDVTVVMVGEELGF